MKYFVLSYVLVFYFIGCQSVDSQKIENSNNNFTANSSQVEKILISEDTFNEFTVDQKKKLDSRIPPKVRDILDKAEEIKISYNVDEKTMQLRVLLFDPTPNFEARVSDPDEKKRFLNNFYSDVASNYNGSACFSPRHKISAQYKSKTVDITVCYECSNFTGKSSAGKLGGGLAEDSKSAAIVDEIIKKYGSKIKK